MVREQKVESFYSRLRESVLASSSPLLVFPSTSDVDSLCALRIISHVLEFHGVRYSSFPVSSFREILQYVSSSLFSSDQPVSILLINWGCQRHLRKVLNLGPAARVFVVDSHRPIHLHNLNDENDQVVVLYTQDDENQSDLAYDFDISALASVIDLYKEDEVEGSSDSDDGNESDSDEEDGSGSRKRRRVSEESEADPVKLLRKLTRAYYNVGTFHGKPSGCLMFELSHYLRVITSENTTEMLWWACVSLTDQFVHERLTDERYLAGVMELEQHINSSGNDETNICASGSSRIAYEEEPRLMLLREWNLFDSMLCSSYIATKLKTWSDNGMKKVKLLLARMGFALADCQQKFQYMNLEVKRKMKDEFARYLPEYGLTDFYYRSFLLLRGYASRVSAADVVYGVTALLESYVESDGTSASEKFSLALEALSLSNIDKSKNGMQCAIRIQRAILRQGSAAITKSGAIRSGRKFRWVKLEDSADAKLLGHPQTLTKFCHFLMDALREKGAKMKPLICVCLSQEPNKVLIVGVCGKPRLGAIQGNTFGIAFKNAAEEIGAEFFHDLFESSWIVLDAATVNSFMIRLTEKL